ncbi:cation diffusion facilitator family transporter [Falsigemmobacter faecalis]|uniref:Cation transporter n=1 Tax=Falsigemmobacter faecalis TaxID=2488730 RepID=A0A3P3DNK6_9RHOB|nr:cation diffusion facilitator family transporter [Falsigemmobacter faecalis]RRH75524.1 cation transporter [Falsigemmobacter faecalis]
MPETPETPGQGHSVGHSGSPHDHSAHDHALHTHAGDESARHDHSAENPHSHDHAGHDHSHAPKVTGGNERRIFIVLVLTAGYALIQAVGGWLSGSLALVADSGHMLSDAAALALALVAYRVARRAADEAASYGYHRVRVLAALANGAALLLLVAWITWEAVTRLRTPVEVMAGPMLVVAVIGLLVNLIGAFVLMRGEGSDQNLKGALLHVIGDLLGSVGAIGASVGIMLTGWMPLDPILSVLVAVLVLRSAWGLVKASLHVLLQGTPAGLAPEVICADLEGLAQVAAAGHVHVWTLTDERYVATVHVSAADGAEPLDLPDLVRARLAQRFGIEHATVEVNRAGELRRGHGPESA